jgi:hypothetical protein
MEKAIPPHPNPSPLRRGAIALNLFFLGAGRCNEKLLSKHLHNHLLNHIIENSASFGFVIYKYFLLKTSIYNNKLSSVTIF